MSTTTDKKVSTAAPGPSLSGQTRLFNPPPPDFDDMCPPGPEEQLQLDIATADLAARQMTTYDYDC